MKHPMRIPVLNQPGFKQESNEIGGFLMMFFFLTRGVSSSGRVFILFRVTPGVTTDRSGGLQSFLLGRELLRERRRLPEIIEENTHAENKAPEARFFFGGIR